MSAQATEPTILIRVRMTTKAYAMLERRAKQFNRAAEIEAGMLLQGTMVNLMRRADLMRALRERIAAPPADRADSK